MRITGGRIGGRILKVPSSMVRPTQDKVRAALFSILAARIPGCRFLDLYAGSGAVGLEAWSRDAESVCWVEGSHKVAGVLEDNILTLTGGKGTVYRSDVLKFLKKRLVAEKFDIIFCDPPYDKDGEGGVIGEILAEIAGSGLLSPDGVFVMEQDTGEPEKQISGWNLFDVRSYGNTRLSFFAAAGTDSGKAE